MLNYQGIILLDMTMNIYGLVSTTHFLVLFILGLFTTRIHYNITQVTLIHPTIFHVANPQRLPCASMRDPGYATLEAGRGLPRYRKGQWD